MVYVAAMAGARPDLDQETNELLRRLLQAVSGLRLNGKAVTRAGIARSIGVVPSALTKFNSGHQGLSRRTAESLLSEVQQIITQIPDTASTKAFFDPVELQRDINRIRDRLSPHATPVTIERARELSKPVRYANLQEALSIAEMLLPGGGWPDDVVEQAKLLAGKSDHDLSVKEWVELCYRIFKLFNGREPWSSASSSEHED